MALPYLCGRKTHEYQYWRSSTFSDPPILHLSVIVSVHPGKPLVCLCVTMDPSPLIISHGGTLNVHDVVAASDLDGLTTQKAILTMLLC